MRKCPRCGQVSFDNNQNFCLKDGETLIFSNDSQPTVHIDPRSFSTASTPQKQGVSAGFAYATIALLALLIGGGIVALVLVNPFAAKTEPATQAQTAQNSQTNQPATNPAINQQTSAPFQPAPTPVIVKVPTSPPVSKTRGLKMYGGNIGGENASFDLVWNGDKTISGNYYLQSHPNDPYTVTGTNYTEGVSDLRVSSGGTYIGQMKLNKTLEGNMLCWQGYFSAGNQYVRFCRRR